MYTFPFPLWHVRLLRVLLNINQSINQSINTLANKGYMHKVKLPLNAYWLVSKLRRTLITATQERNFIDILKMPHVTERSILILPTLATRYFLGMHPNPLVNSPLPSARWHHTSNLPSQPVKTAAGSWVMRLMDPCVLHEPYHRHLITFSYRMIPCMIITKNIALHQQHLMR